MKYTRMRLLKVKKTRAIKAVAKDDPGLVFDKQGRVELSRDALMTTVNSPDHSDD